MIRWECNTDDWGVCFHVTILLKVGTEAFPSHVAIVYIPTLRGFKVNFFFIWVPSFDKKVGSMVTIKQRHSSTWNIFLHVNNHQLSCKCGMYLALFHDKMDFSTLYFESYCFQSQLETKLRWNMITCLKLFTLKGFWVQAFQRSWQLDSLSFS